MVSKYRRMHLRLGFRVRPEPGVTAKAALTRAGVAAGCDALFIESHPEPSQARCDAASQWPLAKLEDLLRQALDVYHAAQQYL